MGDLHGQQRNGRALWRGRSIRRPFSQPCARPGEPCFQKDAGRSVVRRDRQRIGGRNDRKTWGGLKMLSGHQVAPEDSSRKRTEEHFTRNLEDILQVAAKAGVKVILCTVGSNLRDCAPFASMRAPSLTEAQRETWNRHYQNGVAAATSGQWDAALAAYSQAAQIDPFHAELQFRIGQCHEAQTNSVLALESYQRARDSDALPVRATSTMNGIVGTDWQRQSGQGVILLDAAGLLNRESKDGIAGDDLFLDHVHLGFDGNYRLARAVADQVSGLFTNASAGAAGGGWLTPVQCDLRLGLTDWNRHLALEEMLARFSDAPYTNQLNHTERRRRYRERLAELRTQLRRPTGNSYVASMRRR